MDPGGAYIHGTHPEEQERLSRLNGLLNARSLGALRLEGGESVLDVGCGLGQLTLDIARACGPGGRVVGVERSVDQLRAARRLGPADGAAPVEFRPGDVHELPLADAEWGRFDLAHARFILEHVDDPLAVVRAMVRAVRPGGRIVLEDDDHDILRLWPPAAGVETLWRAYIRTYQRMSRDPYVGRHLVSLLHEAGATPVRNDLLPFGSCAGEETFEPLVGNFIGILEGAREKILAGADVDTPQFDAAIDSFRRWAGRPDAALWYATCWAEGVVDGAPPDAGTWAGLATMQADAAREPAAWSGQPPQLTSDSSMLRLLVDTSENLTSTLDLDAVFQKVAARVRALVDCQLFCVLLWNPETQMLEHSYSTCYDEHIEIDPSGAFPIGYGICGHAAANRAPIRVGDVRKDSRYVRYRHPEVEIRSELAVPLLFRDRLVGVIDLESTSIDAFSHYQERLLTALASQIAIALENARLYRQIAAGEKRLEKELATAREIQRALLPDAPPAVDGIGIGAVCAPARELGGDFYDFITLRDERIVIAVGDVAGKGTPAALHAAAAIGALRGRLRLQRGGPAALLAELNPQLAHARLENRFVALALGVLDPAARTLTIASAGLPAPILVRDGRGELIPEGGIPLGLIASQTYTQREIELRKGDVVAFCSDGIHDSVNRMDEEFGTRRLVRLLTSLDARSAQEVAERIVGVTDLHTGEGREQSDDRTAVVLRVE